MTVGELKELLNKYDDDSLEVFISQKNEWVDQYDVYEIDSPIEGMVIDYRNNYEIINDGIALLKGKKAGDIDDQW